MAKKSFVIACPQCGTFVEGTTGLFAPKILRCSCGNKINVEVEAIQSKECPHCGNNVKYDVRLGEEATCPICHKQLIGMADIINKIDISCPSCSCKISVNKNAESCTCPMCNTKIDVQERIKKEEAKNRGEASVIKYEGDNTTFVWRHPIEDFNSGSQLIVHESQEALLFGDGKAYDVFGAGRYSLMPSTLPLYEGENKWCDGEVLHSQVYFVNLTTQMGIKWGTDSKVRLFDPESNIYAELGARGTFNLRVCDSRKVVLKLVGTTAEFGADDVLGAEGFGIEFIRGKFKSLVMNKVKANLARIITNSKISVLAIDQYVDLISERLKDAINQDLQNYGLEMPEFYITSVLLPDDDPNFIRLKQQYADRTLGLRDEEIKTAQAKARQERVLLEHETEAKIKLVDAKGNAEAMKIEAAAEADAYRMQAMAEADEMRAKNYTQRDVLQASVQKSYADSLSGMGGGSIASDMIGMMVGAKMAESMIDQMNKPIGDMAASIPLTPAETAPLTAPVASVAAPAPSSASTWNCTCGAKDITSKFCPECGSKKPEPVVGWNCPSCGKTGILSNFCPECGSKKPVANATWTCPTCGTADIKTKFCPECGTVKPV